jgi:S-DNA-T family DNA segregation ATPase FtsK/SpoIIIE
VPADRVLTGRAEEIALGVDRLANLAEMGPGARPRMLIIDDVDRLDDFALTTSWERIVRFDELRVVASMESRSMSGYTQSPLVNVLRRSQRLLVLRPDDPADFLATTGVRLPIRPGTELPPGRGVLLVDRVPTVLQVATPS